MLLSKRRDPTSEGLKRTGVALHQTLESVQPRLMAEHPIEPLGKRKCTGATQSMERANPSTKPLSGYFVLTVERPDLGLGAFPLDANRA